MLKEQRAHGTLKPSYIYLDSNSSFHQMFWAKYMTDVRKQQKFYQSAGVSSVPAVIVNDKHLISGGQPSETFEQALKQIAAEQIST